MRGARLGLDESSRDVLLDLIYRLSLRDRDAKDERKERKRSDARKDDEESARDDDDADLTEEERERRARNDRVKEARRAEKTREKKEKVLRKALREDRRNPTKGGGGGGGGGGGDGVDGAAIEGLASAPFEVGSTVNVNVTSTSGGGEVKVVTVKRDVDLKTFLTAAKAKLKLKKKPLSARTHPGGAEISNTLRVLPMSTVAVSNDPPSSVTKPGKDDDEGDGDTREEDDEDVVVDDDDDAEEEEDATARLRSAMATRAARERAKRSRLRLSATEADAESDALARAMTRAPSFPLHDARTRLPAHGVRDEIVRLMDNASAAAIITGETGSGKTTQAPQYALEREIARGAGGRCNIIVAQPRRVAAVSIASRVAEERDERVGDVVGYAVRGDSKTSRRTRLTFVTTGVLLRRLASDPTLEGVTHVFVDEVHERTADADFLLIHLRDILRANARDVDASQSDTWRPPLRVALMSATADWEKLAAYFDGASIDSAPPPGRVHIPGRTFPVEEHFAEDFVKRGGGRRAVTGGPTSSFDNVRGPRGGPRPPPGVDYDLLLAVVRTICTICAKGETEPPPCEGAILVFLPGAAEIAEAEKALLKRLGGDHEMYVVPLHGQLTPKEQQRAFAKPPDRDARKIVLATNVAETSLTIPDVVYVVDSGRVKRLTHDPTTHLAALTEGRCSRASAAQRRGRAGRVKPGVCVRLYDRDVASNEMPETDLPEMHTVPLESLVMAAMASRPETSPEAFLASALDPPPSAAVRAAIARLRSIGAVVNAASTDDALSDNTNSLTLTPLGFHLSHLPVEPRLGKMLVYAVALGCLPAVLTAAAAMSCKPMFHDAADKAAATRAKRDASDKRGGASDHLAAAEGFDAWRDAAGGGGGGGGGGRGAVCREMKLSYSTMHEIHQVRNQLKERLAESGFRPDAPAASAHASNDDLVRAVLVAGLFPNVARVAAGGGGGGGGRGSGGRGGKRQGNGPRVVNSRGVEVTIHPSSVNASSAELPGPREGYYAYQEEVETSRVFLRETTAAPSEAILLFGGALSVDHAASTVTVSAGGGGDGSNSTGGNKPFVFAAKPETGVLFKLLRSELDRQLAAAAADPEALATRGLGGTDAGERLMEVLLKLLPGTRAGR